MAYVSVMAGFRDVVADLAERMDRRLPAGFYAAVSVPTEGVRARLRRDRRAFIDPDAAAVPPMHEVDATAERVIRQASFGSASLGGIASIAGAASVPPEALAQTIAVLRLAQRLAIVYGFDPDTERGRIAVRRALAAGLELDLPDEGPLEVRMSDLPRLLAPRDARSAGLTLARSAVRSTTYMLARRVSRLVPFVSPAFSAVAARRRVQEVGLRMRELLRRLAEVPDAGAIEDATVV